MVKRKKKKKRNFIKFILFLIIICGLIAVYIFFSNKTFLGQIDYTLNLFEKIKQCNRDDCCAIIRVDMYEIPYHKGYFKKKQQRSFQSLLFFIA